MGREIEKLAKPEADLERVKKLVEESEEEGGGGKRMGQLHRSYS